MSLYVIRVPGIVYDHRDLQLFVASASEAGARAAALSTITAVYDEVDDGDLAVTEYPSDTVLWG